MRLVFFFFARKEEEDEEGGTIAHFFYIRTRFRATSFFSLSRFLSLSLSLSGTLELTFVVFHPLTLSLFFIRRYRRILAASSSARRVKVAVLIRIRIIIRITPPTTTRTTTAKRKEPIGFDRPQRTISSSNNRNRTRRIGRNTGITGRTVPQRTT